MKNKETTKRKLLDAVGQVIDNNGFVGLGVNRVSKIAGVSKTLIYRYFGGFNQLVKTYVLEKDFWTNYLSEHDLDENCDLPMVDQIGKLLEEQFYHIYNHCIMEVAMIHEISNENELLKDISNNSQLNGRQLLPGKAESITENATYFNIVSALLIVGTNQLIFQTHKTEEKLLNSMSQIVRWTFG